MRTLTYCEKCGKPAKGAHRLWCGEDPTQRFWAKVDRRGPSECWPWIGSRKPMGYGHFVVGKKDHNAHRFSYELANGPIPIGMHVLHRCDNQPCVNPEHLFLGTHTDNMHDMDAKGRKPRGEATRRHKLTAAAVREIRATFDPGEHPWIAAGETGKKYGVKERAVLEAFHGRSWSHVK